MQSNLKSILKNRNMNKLGYKGNFSNPEATLEMDLALVSYVDDDNMHYIYCPALDLTGYGHTEQEAKNSFEQTLKLYLSYTLNKQTLFADMKAHGWCFILPIHSKIIRFPKFSFILSPIIVSISGYSIILFV